MSKYVKWNGIDDPDFREMVEAFGISVESQCFEIKTNLSKGYFLHFECRKEDDGVRVEMLSMSDGGGATIFDCVIYSQDNQYLKDVIYEDCYLRNGIPIEIILEEVETELKKAFDHIYPPIKNRFFIMDFEDISTPADN